MKKRLNKDGNGETGGESDWRQMEKVTEREHIVKKLNGICNQLLKWGLTQKIADVRRVSFLRAAVYATSIQLQALKDTELDKLMKEIEAIKDHIGLKT